ncbi:MAG: ribonuclease P protein component [Candidatus Sulfotelmatobacter sp.]
MANAARETGAETARRNRMCAKHTSGFPRTARLLRHADFERVYKQGRRHFSASMTVFYWERPEAKAEAPTKTRAVSPVLQGLRIGFTVSRVLGGAVQRNRMKRRLREAVRLSRPVAGVAADVVINPKKSLLVADFADVLNEVRRAFEVIEHKLSAKAATRAGASTLNEPGTGSRP